jgi:hypothetical protein
MDESPGYLRRVVVEQQARQRSLEASAEQSAGRAALANTLANFVTQPGEYVTAQLGGFNCQHFGSRILDGQPASPAAPTQDAAQEPFQLPGESLGVAMIRRATAPKAERGDPRLDPSQPLAFGARTLPGR